MAIGISIDALYAVNIVIEDLQSRMEKVPVVRQHRSYPVPSSLNLDL